MNLYVELASRGFVLVMGVLLWISTTLSLFRTVIVPRPLHSVFSAAVIGFIRGTTRLIARTRRTYAGRDAVLAWLGPLIIIGLLVAWLIGYLVSYGFLLYGTGGGNLGDALRESGSSLFTLGFASSRLEDQTLIDFLAAATGPIVIGMLIGYLPTIYSSYLEREAPVTMLSALAGDPAWGVELLSRASLADTLDELPGLFGEWTRWSAKERLTLTTYPALLYVRSLRTTRHFAVALMAVLDAAALSEALHPGLTSRANYEVHLQGTQMFEWLYLQNFAQRTRRSRLPFVGRFLKSGTPAHGPATLPTVDARQRAVHRAAAEDAAQGMSVEGVRQLSAGERESTVVTRPEFDAAVEDLRNSGFPITRDGDDAWDSFVQARTHYEYPALAMMRALDAVRAPWTGTRSVPTPVITPTRALELLD